MSSQTKGGEGGCNFLKFEYRVYLDNLPILNIAMILVFNSLAISKSLKKSITILGTVKQVNQTILVDEKWSRPVNRSRPLNRLVCSVN